MILNGVITRLFMLAGLVATLVACGSNPTQNMTPQEIAQHLELGTISQITEIAAPATFDLDAINSRTAVMEQAFGLRHLVVFGHSCPDAGFGGAMKTTATGGRLDTEDSIIINDTYCRISELYTIN